MKGPAFPAVMQLRLPLASALVVGAVALLGSGCQLPGMGKAESATDPTRGLAATVDGERQARGIQAFRTTVYPIARKDCASCHGDKQVPKFATTDLADSFEQALTKTNFKQVAQSSLVKRAMDGHCGLDGCKTDGTRMTEAIQLWKTRWDEATSDYDEGLHFVTPSQSVAETADKTTVKIANGASEHEILVQVELTGTTSAGTDFQLPGGGNLLQVTIPPFQTETTVEIPLGDDLAYEGDETIVATLKNPVDAQLGKQTVHVATILEDDPAPTVRWTLATQTVPESTGTVQVSAILSGPSGQPVTAKVGVTGTATTPSDYTAAATTVTFAPGVTTANFAVAVVSDATDENDETVVLTLSDPTGATLGAVAQHTLTIAGTMTPPPMTAPVLSWATSSQTVGENAGSVMVTATLDHVGAQAVTATISLTGTATAGSDYSLGTATLTIPAGNTSANATLTISDDALDENNETVILTLGSPVNSTLGATIAHTVTITDNDATPTVEWSLSSQTESEAVGNATVQASLSAVSGRAVTVPYTFGGTAAAGTDYTATSGTLTISAGSANASIALPILNDTVAEPSDETVTLTIGSPTNANQGTKLVHTITITDNDTASDPKVEAFRTSVYVITRRDCVSCHGINISPFHASSDLNLAYAVAKPKANFNSITSSAFYIKVKDGHCGALCSTNGNEMQTALTAWAAAENTGGGSGGSNGTVLVTADTVLRSGNRRYVKAMLDEVFGPGVATITDPFVKNQMGMFGGPCDHYSAVFNGGAPIGDCSAYGDSQIPIVPGAVSGKFALGLRACEKIVNQQSTSDAAIKFAAAQAMGVGSVTTLVYPTDADIAGAFGLFYPGRTASTQVLADLKAIVTSSQTASYGGADAWRYLLLALCRSPDWQVP